MAYIKHDGVGDVGISSWCRKHDGSMDINMEQGVLHILPLDEDKLLLMYADEENEVRFHAGDENASFTGGAHEGSFVIEVQDGKPVLSSMYHNFSPKT